MAQDPEIIVPPDVLKAKVGYGAGGVDPEVLARAEAAVAGLQAEYLTWAQGDLERLQGAFDAGRCTPDPQRAQAMRRVFEICHDIKGQGGSFGYDLMTVVGGQLCRFVEAHSSYGEREFAVVQLHIDVMRIVIGDRLVGDGGKVGQRLLNGLRAVLTKLG